jgi:hypothetical protein
MKSPSLLIIEIKDTAKASALTAGAGYLDTGKPGR